MKRLKEVRVSRGLTQAELAERVGVTQHAIAQYEAGRRQPQGEILVRIALVLGVSSAYLMGLTDDPKRDDRLPPDWEAVIREAMAASLRPEDVRALIETIRKARDRQR